MDVYSDPTKHVVLSNNIKMPLLGLGTSHYGGYSADAVVCALRCCGYRHIDTAKRYGVEAAIADAIQMSGVPREDVFLATKCWPADYGKHSTRSAFAGSCDRFRSDFIDLYLLHWPVVPSTCEDRKQLLRDTWRTLELLYDEGRVRSIGVSNFEVADLTMLLEDPELSMAPMVDQCEFHPFHNPQLIRDFCRLHNIQFEGFCPLGKGKVLGDATLEEMARRYNKSVAQVLIRWNLQQRVVCIPKSTKPERVQQNCQVFDFQLTQDDMKTLDNFPQTLTIFDRADIQHRVDNPLPDGYRLLNRNLTNGS
ncbi:NADP-dependent oxidoreductase domain [Trinorchestia longiramus]|nr:NADP-dependent oxidoreductase domain [Trinorchestia longiramus]